MGDPDGYFFCNRVIVFVVSIMVPLSLYYIPKPAESASSGGLGIIIPRMSGLRERCFFEKAN